MLLVVGFFSLLAAALAPALGLEMAIFWCGLNGVVCTGLIYYLSRVQERFTPGVIWLLIACAMMVFTSVYYYNAGLAGPVVYLVILLALVLALVAPPAHQGWMVGALGLNMVLLIGAEYAVPGWPIPYPNRLAQFADHATAVPYTLIFGWLAVRAFKASYYRERRRTLRQNALLARQRAQLAAQTTDLQTALALAQARAEFIQSLLRELSHRVKNNLQFVSALLSLQADQTAAPATRIALEESRQRLFSIILLHQRLYHEPDAGATSLNIALAPYLTELINGLLDAGPGADARPRLALTLDDTLVLPTEIALPLGLIVNELLTNALKYAFPGTAGAPPGGACLMCGLVQAALPATGLLLTVADNGVGLPLGTNPLVATGFGLRLVQLLTRQLVGTVSAHAAPGQGVRWEVHLPAPALVRG